MESEHKEVRAVPYEGYEKARNLELATKQKIISRYTYDYANPWPFEFPHGEEEGERARKSVLVMWWRSQVGSESGSRQNKS